MSNVSPEIFAKQQAYAARPYAVRIITSHYSGTQRFHTIREAIAYLAAQYARDRATVKNERYRSFCAWRSVLILPGDIEVRANEFIGDSLSSY